MEHLTARTAVTAVVALAGGGVAAAACGGGPTTGSRTDHARVPRATSVPGTTSAPPPTTSPVPAAAAGQPCDAAQLALAVQGPTGAAGEVLYTLVLRNTAATPCTLTGYPQVALAGGGGTVGQPLGDQPGTTPATVTLAAGGQATAAVALHDPSVFGCPTGTATHVQVVPPGGSGQAAPAALPRPTGVCTGVAPGAVGSNATVTPGTVGPVQPGD